MSRSWWIVVAGFLSIVFTFGVPTMMMPVIYSPLIDEFGWSRTQVTFVATLKFGAGAVFGIFFGALVDRFSIRRIVMLASITSGVAMASFLLVQSLWQYYLAGLVLGLGSIAVMIAVKVLVSRRFMRRQGFAIGAALLGTSVAGTFTPVLARALIEQYGWRMTVALLSVGIWTIALPTFLAIVKDAEKESAGPEPEVALPPARAEQLAAAEMEFSEVVRSRSFWMIGLALMLIGFVDQAMGQHLVLYLERDVGLGLSVAATTLSAVFFVSIVGKLGFGWLYDKLSVHGVMLCYFLMAVAVILAFPVQLLPVLIAFTVVRGLAHGGAIVDIPVLSKHCFGPKVLGKTIGVLTACVTVGFALGPPVVGYIHDVQGSYRNAFLLLIGVSIAAGLALLGVKATYRERVAALEQAARGEPAQVAWGAASSEAARPSS
jgi:MFS family permease